MCIRDSLGTALGAQTLTHLEGSNKVKLNSVQTKLCAVTSLLFLTSLLAAVVTCPRRCCTKSNPTISPPFVGTVAILELHMKDRHGKVSKYFILSAYHPDGDHNPTSSEQKDFLAAINDVYSKALRDAIIIYGENLNTKIDQNI
eukprot:14022513-Ditylum_brightwellii.AAC.1